MVVELIPNEECPRRISSTRKYDERVGSMRRVAMPFYTADVYLPPLTNNERVRVCPSVRLPA